MNIKFGREVCGNLEVSEHREWLITNGIGGYKLLPITMLPILFTLTVGQMALLHPMVTNS